MALELKQSMKLAQQLVITPQLQQAIRLLQLSRLELATLMQTELLENPVLEDGDGEDADGDSGQESNAEKHEKAKDEDRGHEHAVDEVGSQDGTLKEPADFDWENYLDTFNARSYTGERDRSDDEAPTYENVVSQSESLHDHLLWQLQFSGMAAVEREIGKEIIGNINDDGYLQATLEEIAARASCSAEEAAKVLDHVQGFDPAGVAARDVKECLILQTKGMAGGDRETTQFVIRECLAELERHDYPGIARKAGIPPERVKEIVAIISHLDPKPGRPFSQELPQYITPDVYVQKGANGEYMVILNEDGLPKLKVSDFYRRALMRGSGVGSQTKDYIQDRLRSAVWLIRSIHQRQRTLYRVASSIVKFQREFFDNGVGHLKPLVLRDVADDIEMHESTISRVTANKFVHTPRGIFELKFFFNSGLSQLEGGGVASEVVKIMLKKLVDGEDPRAPLSDQELAAKLKERNIDIARRTVAKYRETLGILPSATRRRDATA